MRVYAEFRKEQVDWILWEWLSSRDRLNSRLESRSHRCHFQ